MSTTTEMHQMQNHDQVDMMKKEQQQQHSNGSQSHNHSKDSDKHPLHQYDLSIMTKLYEACTAKARDENMIAKNWKPEEWAKMAHERPHDVANPTVVGQKQRVYELFAHMARETGEPIILIPNLDFGDVISFERFLDALKIDGINAIGRYKQYLNSRDIRKLEVDLVVIHPTHGILLIETKESDMMDGKKRARARMHLNTARQSFESVMRLILEANGLKPSECQVPVYQFVALPNVHEIPPVKPSQQPSKSLSQPSTPSSSKNATNMNAAANTSTSSIGSTSTHSSIRPNRALNYIIKSDLDDYSQFLNWWKRCVEDPSRLLAEAKREEEEREKEKHKENEKEKKMMSKKDLINQMLGLMACIRNNSILPVVYPEMEIGADGMMASMMESVSLSESASENKEEGEIKDKERDDKNKEKEEKHNLNAPALKIYAEFLTREHERARALSRSLVLSRDSEKIRRTICLQAMWLLLNDASKKISVVTSEANKPYYEEFFARQRKVYNNLNNLRFYVDIHSCDPSQHTLKLDGEIWFFDSGVTMKSDSGIQIASLNDILMRVKDLQSYWIFTDNFDQVGQHNQELEGLGVKHVRLDDFANENHNHHHHHMEASSMARENLRIKMPMRLQSDLLIVGDLISPAQLKYLYKHLKSNSVLNQSHLYQHDQQQSNGHHQKQQQYQQLKFNPAKKFRSVKFIRGGSIENLRSALKMHDSIQAAVIVMHVGDEDLFKNRQSMTTIERVKELATLVREYCPKSFVVLSTLMRRQSRTENGVILDVNKGMKDFCKQTKDSINCFYMVNQHFEPEYHTQGGRLLTAKGLKLFADNILFSVDYFFIRNNKQH